MSSIYSINIIIKKKNKATLENNNYNKFNLVIEQEKMFR